MSFIDSSTRSGLTPSKGVEAVNDEETSDISGEEEEEESAPEPEKRTVGIKANLIKQINDINLARSCDQQTLDEIGSRVIEEYEIDLESRADWAEKASKALKFALQESQPKTYPWPNASNIVYPLIAQSALDFGSRTYPALIQNRNVVKGVVWGDDNGTLATVDGTPNGQPRMASAVPGQSSEPVWIVKPGERRERADLIGEHMSWQLLEEMPEWEPQTDQLLHQIPVIGGTTRKTYYEPAEERNYSLVVSLLDLVWDYRAASFGAAQRHSERLMLYPHEIRTRENTGLGANDQDGMFLCLDYGPATISARPRDIGEEDSSADASDPDLPHLFIEQHRRWDLDDDGYAEPYVITVHHQSRKVVRIVARYDADGIVEAKRGRIQRIEPIEYYTLIPFLPNIEGGSYPMGFGHLLRPLNEGINTTLNQMFDAGHLQNAGGGFVSNDLNAASGEVRISVGKYTRVNTRGQSIRDSIFPIPFAGPSPVLFQLLGVLLTAGKELASVQNILTGDAAIAQAPPTTVLALIEQGMKVHNAIQKRVFLAFKSEFRKLFNLNRKHMKSRKRFKVGDVWRTVTPADYAESGGVEPVADPSMTTDMQKLGRAQVILMTCAGDQNFDQRAVKTRVLEGAHIDRISDLYAKPDPNAAAMAQMAMAKAQAELGAERAREQRDMTQAFLNMAQARKIASAPEEAQIQAQMNFMRLRIEALNTMTKAAAVDHKFHHTNSDMEMRQAELDAQHEAEGQTPPPPTATPTPGPTGPFPLATATPPPAMPPPAPTKPTVTNGNLPPLPPPGADPLMGAPGHAPSPMPASSGLAPPPPTPMPPGGPGGNI